MGTIIYLILAAFVISNLYFAYRHGKIFSMIIFYVLVAVSVVLGYLTEGFAAGCFPDWESMCGLLTLPFSAGYFILMLVIWGIITFLKKRK